MKPLPRRNPAAILFEAEQALGEQGMAETCANILEALTSPDQNERQDAKAILNALADEEQKTRLNLKTALGRIWPGNWKILRERVKRER